MSFRLHDGRMRALVPSTARCASANGEVSWLLEATCTSLLVTGNVRVAAARNLLQRA